MNNEKFLELIINFSGHHKIGVRLHPDKNNFFSEESKIKLFQSIINSFLIIDHYGYDYFKEKELNNFENIDHKELVILRDNLISKIR